MTEQFKYTIVPWRNSCKLIKTGRRDTDGIEIVYEQWTKVVSWPVPFDTYEYGQVYNAQTLQDQPGVVCSPAAELVVVDVDNLSLTGSSAVYAALRDLYQVPSVQRSDDPGHQHWHLDYRAIPDELWPTQGSVGWGDIKSNGFVAAPGCTHYTGNTYDAVGDIYVATVELATLIKAERDSYEVHTHGRNSGTVGGGQNGRLFRLVWRWASCQRDPDEMFPEWVETGNRLKAEDPCDKNPGWYWSEKDRVTFDGMWQRCSKRYDEMVAEQAWQFEVVKHWTTALPQAEQIQPEASTTVEARSQSEAPSGPITVDQAADEPAEVQTRTLVDDAADASAEAVEDGSSTGDDGFYDQPEPAKPHRADSDASVGEMFAYSSRVNGQYCYATGLGWLKYDGRRWDRVEDVIVLEEARQWVIENYRAAAYWLSQAVTEDERKHWESVLVSWHKYKAAGSMGNVVRVARGIGPVIREASKFDQHSDLLNVANGVVNLRTRELHPHHPEFLFTKMAPANYYQGAAHADWDKTLEAVPTDARRYLQLRFGQAVTGCPAVDDVILFNTGGGENGKTTVFGAIMQALGLGQYYSVLNAKLIGQDAEKDHPTELMDLRGARFAVIEELPEGKHLSVQSIKNLTQPQLKGRYMHKDFVVWDSTHCLFINSNPLPLVAETDHGTWRRLRRLHWPYTYHKPHVYDALAKVKPTDRRGEDGLRERMKAGDDGIREAVLAWLVDGAFAWFDGNEAVNRKPKTFGRPPGRVEQDTETWQERANPLVAFFKEFLVVDSTSHVRTSTTAAMAAAFLEGRGHKRLSESTLNDRLLSYYLQRGADVERRKQRVSQKLSRYKIIDGESSPDWEVPATYQAYLGLRWRTEADEDLEVAAVDGETTLSELF